MKVSINWLKELVDLNVTTDELIRLLPLRTIGTKEVTKDFVELDMKGYNRADLLSLRGVAYEAAAITGSAVKFEERSDIEHIWLGQNLPKVDVEVTDDKLCPIYAIARIEGLKVESSNPSWKKKLEDSGMRSVNNLADVTNLVMLEFGQPLHAFDAAKVADEKIIVRTANEGEKIRTLDDKVRELDKNDLLICDPNGPIGIAGVMGGKESEVTGQTETILLEAAMFSPQALRATANRLNLASDAAKRFYHGLTEKRLFQALEAAIKMYQELGGKLTGLTIVGENETPQLKVPLTGDKTRSLIGVEISDQQIEDTLKKLNFDTERINGSWVVTPPYYRLDIEFEEDLIEEVARMYGYENIKAKSLEGEMPGKIDQSMYSTIYEIKKTLTALGLTEVQTYSFFTSQVLKNLGWLENDNLRNLVKIANPISKETEYLRQNIWGNLVEVAADNLKYFEEVAVFEVGKVYSPADGDRPKEQYALSISVSGKSDNPISDLYQIFKKLVSELDLDVQIDQELGEKPFKQLFHPTRVYAISKNGKQIGGMAELHPRTAYKFGLGKRLAIMEVYLEDLINN